MLKGADPIYQVDLRADPSSFKCAKPGETCSQ